MPEEHFEMDQGRINTVPTSSTVSATATLPKFKLMMLGMIYGSANSSTVTFDLQCRIATEFGSMKIPGASKGGKIFLPTSLIQSTHYVLASGISFIDSELVIVNRGSWRWEDLPNQEVRDRVVHVGVHAHYRHRLRREGR